MASGMLAIDSSAPRILGSLVLVAITAYALYQLLLHPLRRFPGPVLARITSAYGAFYVWRLDIHIVSVDLHKTYGPVIRLAPNRLVFNSATALQDIYNNARVSKGRAYLQMRASGNGTANLFNSLDKAEHRAKRRIIGPVIGESSMRIFEPDMQRQINTFLLQLLLSTRDHQPLNMTPCCERLGVDVVGQLAFGYPLQTQVEPTHRVIVEGITARGKRNSLYFFWPRLRFLETFFNMVQGSEPIKGWQKSVMTMIKARMEQPIDAKHDFYALASPKLGEPGLVSKDLWAEAVFFVAAGGSTTSTALSGAFFYLSRNRDAYERLAAEIRTTFTSSREIRNGPQLNACKYLRAVIEETMRMSPSTLSHAWREQDPASVAAGESLIIDGHVIPPGTQVAVSQYSLQHNEKYFPEPFKFHPDRWLASENDTPERQSELTAMRRAFAPFSIGDRACAGKAMAWLEMKLTIAHTLWYFDFEPSPGTDGQLGGGSPDGKQYGRGAADEFQLFDSVVTFHDGPSLVFKPYEDHWKDLELIGQD